MEKTCFLFNLGFENFQNKVLDRLQQYLVNRRAKPHLPVYSLPHCYDFRTQIKFKGYKILFHS